MIDPKLDKIPADFEDLTDEEIEARKRATPIAGLSINDTIARNANMSVGARGVDTSGTAAGAGAGAGTTLVTPAASDSPAPELVPGSRGTGSTPQAEAPTRTKR